jgi:hypothetical protein
MSSEKAITNNKFLQGGKRWLRCSGRVFTLVIDLKKIPPAGGFPVTGHRRLS